MRAAVVQFVTVQIHRSDSGDIAAGDHVHVHNVKSDYTPTYHLEDVRAEQGSGA